MRLAIGVTGSSATHLGYKFINAISDDIELHIVLSQNSKYSSELENNNCLITHKNCQFYDNKDIGASLASGSFKLDKFAIIPCSMNTLAKCSVGIADSLITRAFSVSLKEKREILLAPREMPFSSIALENMLKLSNLGVTIAPPVIGYYSEQQTLEEMENFLIGKWLDLLKIENNLYRRWEKN